MRILLLTVCALMIGGCLSCKQKAPFKKFWRAHFKKVYNWVLADSEALKYKDKETAARAYLQELRAIANMQVVASRIQSDGFQWHAESVDFTSYPWVTIARKRGDCDDYMLLWEAVVKYRGKTKRVSVSSTEDRSHAMLLFYPEGAPTVLYALSNYRVLGQGRPGEEGALVRLFYGDKTDCYILY